MPRKTRKQSTKTKKQRRRKPPSVRLHRIWEIFGHPRADGAISGITFPDGKPDTRITDTIATVPEQFLSSYICCDFEGDTDFNVAAALANILLAHDEKLITAKLGFYERILRFDDSPEILALQQWHPIPVYPNDPTRAISLVNWADEAVGRLQTAQSRLPLGSTAPIIALLEMIAVEWERDEDQNPIGIRARHLLTAEQMKAMGALLKPDVKDCAVVPSGLWEYAHLALQSDYQGEYYRGQLKARGIAAVSRQQVFNDMLRYAEFGYMEGWR